MKSLTIRGLPSEVHTNLKERAKRNRRSLNQEVIAELSSLADIEPVDEGQRKRARAEAMIAKSAEFRKGLSGFLTAEEIDAGIREGRR